MPNTPNTQAVANAIVTLALTAQYGGLPAYSNGKAGEYKDITDLVPCLEVYSADDDTQRAAISMGGIGGAIEVFDDQTFWLVSTVDLMSSATAWTTVWGIRDALTQLFHSSAGLSLAGVQFVQLMGKGRYEPVYRSDKWWLMHRVKLYVKYEYTTTLTT